MSDFVMTLSPDQQFAWDKIKTGKNLFITARAGAGKSYLIEYIKRNYKGRMLVCASTGIAANNVGGRTLHSTFLINPFKMSAEDSVATLSVARKKGPAIKKARLLIIDEVSMVSDRLLDCINDICKWLRKDSRPFGGLQVVFFGDFLQLPPVFKGDSANDKICWDCKSWTAAGIETVLLSSNFRQAQDTNFYDLLSRLRYNQLTYEDIRALQSRAVPADDTAIRIFSTNEEVDKYNDHKYNQLDEATEHKYWAKCNGDMRLIESYWKDSLIPEELFLRKGARVMLCKNWDLGDDMYLYNGSLGEVIGFTEEEGLPLVRFDSGMTFMVEPQIIYQPMEYDTAGEPYSLATISQLPLKLAYAVTVHKSQGQTFDKVLMDCSRVFVCGQVYVALSRARTLDGLCVYGFNPSSRGSISDPWIVNRYLQLEQEAALRNQGGTNGSN